MAQNRFNGFDQKSGGRDHEKSIEKEHRIRGLVEVAELAEEQRRFENS
jgi:hypothetical protein